MQDKSLKLVGQLGTSWKIAWKVLRWVLWLGVFGYCSKHFYDGYSPEIKRLIQLKVQDPSFLVSLVTVVGLVPLNWWLESKRWQLLVKPKYTVSLVESWRGVWMGMAAGLWLPKVLGEYFGRVGELGFKSTKTSAKYFFGSQATMMVATLVLGLPGVLLLLQVEVVWVLLSGVGIFVWPVFLWHGGHFLSSRWFNAPLFSSFEDFLRIQLLSYGRYGIIALQYFLLLRVFLETSVLETFGGIGWVFLVKSGLPFFHAFVDLGVREFSALVYFESLQVSAPLVLTPTLLLWGVNVMFPLMLGSFVWLGKKNRI